MKPVPLKPNLPTPTTAFGTPTPIAQYYICPHCNKQSPLVRDWVGLTDEDKAEIVDATERDERGYVMALVEAKLKEKNT